MRNLSRAREAARKAAQLAAKDSKSSDESRGRWAEYLDAISRGSQAFEDTVRGGQGLGQSVEDRDRVLRCREAFNVASSVCIANQQGQGVTSTVTPVSTEALNVVSMSETISNFATEVISSPVTDAVSGAVTVQEAEAIIKEIDEKYITNAADVAVAGDSWTPTSAASQQSSSPSSEKPLSTIESVVAIDSNADVSSTQQVFTSTFAYDAMMDDAETDDVGGQKTAGMQELWLDVEVVPATNAFSMSEDAQRSMNDIESGNAEASDSTKSVIDTSAEAVVTPKSGTETAVAVLITTLDILFFLIETVLKAAIPLFRDGGGLVVSRAVEALQPSSGIGISPSWKQGRRRKQPLTYVSAQELEDRYCKASTWRLLLSLKANKRDA